jgi:hypothetical protein
MGVRKRIVEAESLQLITSFGTRGLDIPFILNIFSFPCSILAPNMQQASIVAIVSSQMRAFCIRDCPSERVAAIIALCVKDFEEGAVIFPLKLSVSFTIISDKPLTAIFEI